MTSTAAHVDGYFERATLVYTDLVDSTRLGEQLGEAAMRLLWLEHDEAARLLLRRHGGIEIGRSDGFLLLFREAAPALTFAGLYHSLLAVLNPALSARIGIHAGPVRLRSNDAEATQQGATRFDLDGAALPIVARVMNAAMPCQTLLTRYALAEVKPDDATSSDVVSHGHWRLKGVEAPIELFELPHALAPLQPPPDSAKASRVVRSGQAWLSLSDIAHNLPAERDFFVGRRDELCELSRRVAQGCRLITLCGTGGAGKTRTALRYARTWLGDFPGGVVFAELASARDRDGLLRAVAQGLGVPLDAGEAVERLGQALAARGRALVLLDNFEHLLSQAADTVGTWLDRAPEVSFLVTTRAVLGLRGEQVLQLDSLPPKDSAELFSIRAAAAASHFKSTSRDEAAIDALVKLLDGLPLAIELAAARVRLAPPSELLHRMSDRFRLLAASGSRADRQATLRKTFDWSWDLLGADEKSALAQLSVFVGGFSLAAAEAVVALPDGGDAWSLDVVQSLVDKSLVRSGAGGRLELLQTVQQYAAEHLSAPGRFPASGPDAACAAEARHARWFTSLRESEAAADGGIELPNLLAACRRAVAQGYAPLAAASLARAWAAIRMSGPFGMALELAALVGGMPGLAEPEQAVLHGVAGEAMLELGSLDAAQERLMRAISLSHRAGLAAQEARWLCAAARASLAIGAHDRAGQLLQQAAVAAERAGDDAVRERVHNGLGSLAFERGQLAEARRQFETALALARRCGDRQWEGGLLSNLGAIAHGEGRADDALALLTESLNLTSNLRDRSWQGSAYCNLGVMMYELGRHTEARHHLDQSLWLARTLGRAALEYMSLCNLGLVAEAEGGFIEARSHLEDAVEAARRCGDAHAEGLFRGYLARVYAGLGLEREARACIEAGTQLLQGGADVLSLGLLHACAAEALCRLRDVGAAFEALGRASDLLSQSGNAPDSELGLAIRRAQDLIASGSAAQLRQ